MEASQANTDHKWTYVDYCSWPDKRCWEFINGVAHSVSHSPSRRHQQVLVALLLQFANYFRLTGRKCEIYTNPFDVRLPDSAGRNDDDILTVVKPDLFVVRDQNKLDDRGCLGTPDLIVEIQSPHTAEYNLKVKFDLYEQAGCAEFWLMQPVDMTLMVFKLADSGKYTRPDMYGGRDLVPVPLLGELVIMTLLPENNDSTEKNDVWQS